MANPDHPIAAQRSTPKQPNTGPDRPGPMARRVWILLLWVTLGYSAFVLYGSLVPLHFQPQPLHQAVARFQNVPYLQLGIASRADWVANILLFVPLAFLWHAVSWTSRGRALRLVNSVVILFCCFGLSVAIEFAQIFFPPRTVSLNDIIAESIGALTGTALWWWKGVAVVSWFGEWSLAHTPAGHAGRLLLLYLFVLFGYGVMPLDLTISGIEIYHKWRDGKLLLLPFTATYGTWAQQAYALAADTAIWIPAGFLWSLSSTLPVRKVVGYLTGLAALIEVLQIFVYSRVTSTTDIITAFCGAAIGAALAAWWRPRHDSHEVEKSQGVGGKRMLLWVAGLALWSGVIIAVFWYPFDFKYEWGFLHQRLATLNRVPFEAYYYGTEYRALTEVFHKVGFFLPLGAILAVGTLGVQRSRSIPVRLLHLFSAAAIVGAGAGIEIGQLFLPGKNADVTDWFLATIGGGAGYVAMMMIGKRSRAAVNSARLASRSQPMRVRSGELAPKVTFRWMRVLWGPIVVVGLVWLATHSPLSPYNVRKLLHAPYPLFSIFMLMAAMHWILGLPVLLARVWVALDRKVLWAAVPTVLGYGFGAWVLLRLAVPLEMIEKLVGSPVLGWPMELEDIARFVALFITPAIAMLGATLFAGFAVHRTGEPRIARITWILAAMVLLPICYWVVVMQAGTDNIVELLAEGGSAFAASCLFLYVALLALSSTLVALFACMSLRGRVISSCTLILAVPLGYLLLWMGLESVLVKYGRAFSAMQFLLSASREAYAAPVELAWRFLVAHVGIVALGATCQVPFWTWVRAAPGLKSVRITV